MNYEIGTKMRLLDGRMCLDAAVFFTDWSDQQVTRSQIYTQHAEPECQHLADQQCRQDRGQGPRAELALEGQPELGPECRLRLHGCGVQGALRRRLRDQLSASPVTTAGPCPSAVASPTRAAATNFADAAGFQTANAPKSTGTLGAEFRIPVGSRVELVRPRRTTRYQSERFAEVYNHASTGESTRLDARFGAETDAWKVTRLGPQPRRRPFARLGASLHQTRMPAFASHPCLHMCIPNGRQFGLTATYKF